MSNYVCLGNTFNFVNNGWKFSHEKQQRWLYYFIFAESHTSLAEQQEEKPTFFVQEQLNFCFLIRFITNIRRSAETNTNQSIKEILIVIIVDDRRNLKRTNIGIAFLIHVNFIEMGRESDKIFTFVYLWSQLSFNFICDRDEISYGI